MAKFNVKVVSAVYLDRDLPTNGIIYQSPHVKSEFYQFLR